LIETLHLSKLYGRGVYALRDLSLSIDKGEFLFLTGPSGAGKSTFLRLLLREELPSEGELMVDGRDLGTLRPAQIQSYRRSPGSSSRTSGSSRASPCSRTSRSSCASSGSRRPFSSARRSRC
jgi:ABC-type phosphate/phosphonate transport system ATPase subunit